MTPFANISRAQLAAFCERWNVQELALFGSALRDDFRSDSDVDVLVTFNAGTRLDLRTLMAMERELEAIFGREVDLIERRVIEGSENYIRRRSILESAETIYRAA